jgi:hypothetical protein
MTSSDGGADAFGEDPGLAGADNGAQRAADGDGAEESLALVEENRSAMRPRRSS